MSRRVLTYPGRTEYRQYLRDAESLNERSEELRTKYKELLRQHSSLWVTVHMDEEIVSPSREELLNVARHRGWNPAWLPLQRFRAVETPTILMLRSSL